MYKGIYIAASGAVLKQTQLEVVSQNIANANTIGYKKDQISFQEHLLENGAPPDGRTMTNYSAIKTDLSNGTITRTGNPLDIAIEGNGLIALEGGRYTRRGDLMKNSEGVLVTATGVKVMGAGGPIRIPADALSMDISPAGKVSVMQQGTTEPTDIDTIKIVEFGPDAVISRAGDGQLTVVGGTPKTGTGVKQGYLEASNVDAVKEMVHMIELMREFESYQKMIQTFDDAAGNVNNNLGRL